MLLTLKFMSLLIIQSSWDTDVWASCFPLMALAIKISSLPLSDMTLWEKCKSIHMRSVHMLNLCYPIKVADHFSHYNILMCFNLCFFEKEHYHFSPPVNSNESYFVAFHLVISTDILSTYFSVGTGCVSMATSWQQYPIWHKNLNSIKPMKKMLCNYFSFYICSFIHRGGKGWWYEHAIAHE